MSAELKPCPFCGARPDSKVVEGSTFRWRRVAGCCVDGPEVRYDTLATDMHAAEADAAVRAVAAWNTRATVEGEPPQAVPAGQPVAMNDLQIDACNRVHDLLLTLVHDMEKPSRLKYIEAALALIDTWLGVAGWPLQVPRVLAYSCKREADLGRPACSAWCTSMGHCPASFTAEVPAAPAVPQQPVAWLVHGGRVFVDSVHMNLERATKQAAQNTGAKVSPLYASPPAGTAAAVSDDTRAKYEELLFAVGKKFPDETRHQTALRYIREREAGSASDNQPKASQP